MSLVSVLFNPLRAVVYNAFGASMRWAINFDGVGVRGQLANRAINPDGDIDIVFYTPDTFGATKVIVSQNVTSTNTAKEFQLETGATGSLIIRLGGAAQNMGTVLPATKYRISLVGTSLVLYSKEGTVVSSLTFNRGATREPTAVTVVGAATNGVANIYAFYFTGIQRDIKINGKLYPMRDYNQAIQLPLPTGLGDELITQSVLENPQIVGNQWSYLGSGRWQYIGDGSPNVLAFIGAGSQPSAGYVTFEVESITGGVMRCSLSGTVNSASDPLFSTVGVKRYFFTARDVTNAFQFARNTSTAISCVIKNISFKPLGTCNPMTISNATSANWVQVVDDYNPKFRKVLRFDGVGARGVLAKRAIDPDGDIDIEFYSPPDITVRQVIIGQQINLLGSSEFYIESAANSRLIVVVGAPAVLALTTEQGYEAGKKYRIKLVGTTLTVWKTAISDTDAPILTTTVTRGTVREPAAITVIGAAVLNAAGNYTRWFAGIQRDVKINGTLWPIADATQTIQLPEPSGLGAELITPIILENPAVKGTQWTYLGGGRWQYVGDGTYNELSFISAANQPNSGFLEFEVESINGVMMCSQSSPSIPSSFNTVGVKRYYFTNKDNNGVTNANAVIFKRQSGSVFCIIKNISFKPLGTCNPITLANVTSANWEDLEI